MKFSSVIVLSNNVNSVYIVNSGCSFNSFLAVAFSLSFFLEMAFGAGCVFPRHDTWRHVEVVISDLRVASVEALRFCVVDTSKNKGRKRKVCQACRGRITTELKCMRLEVTSVFVLFINVCCRY